jgi:hypothetical protein
MAALDAPDRFADSVKPGITPWGLVFIPVRRLVVPFQTRHGDWVQIVSNTNPKRDLWSPPFRLAVVLLSATSIWSLLVEFFQLWSMRNFVLFVFLPASAGLAGLALADRALGTQRLWRSVIAGALAGLLAAVTYDGFRLPFVYAVPLGLQRILPALDLFKVFPQFGAMILGEPLRQAHYSLAAQLVGWAYHFSNGLTFGIMFVALVGRAEARHLGWGVLFAVGLELALLFSPYPGFFQIPLTAGFVVVTLFVHLIFGLTMGWTAPVFWRWLRPG